jgi:nucleoside-diphosphate-sugar epimerase
LGYHCANSLGKKGIKSVLIDVASYDESEYPQGTEFHRTDTRDRSALDRVLQSQPIHAVIHAAAALPLEKKAVIYAVNLEGTRNVLEAAKEAGVGRVVFISSTAVYGVPKKHPVTEDDELVGVGPYGHTKIEGERLCESFRGDDFCVPIIRPKTFVGTGRLGVFQILFDWVECGCRIPIIGSGKNRYQLLEVEDLVDAIHLCATGEASVANDTFNVGATEFRTVAQDVGALCLFAGTGARPMGTPAWLIKPILAVFEAMRLSPLYKWVYGTADRESYVSTERIQQRLGWKPRFSNREALIRSYEWYLANKTQADDQTGVTHRVAWDQGILKIFKKILA